MKKQFLILLLFIAANVLIYAQKQVITGLITAESGEPLPGATVILKGTTVGTVSDVDGNYSIEVDETTGTLVFSFVGYTTKELQINGQTKIDVVLAAEVKGLEEVVVIGYGTQKKSLVTGAIAKVNNEALEKSTATRFEQALQGKTSGVVITQNSGSPGSRLNIKIRGNSSYRDNDPLIIVDGIKLGAGGYGLEYLNPDDIESIEVLKDAASSAIYGSEGGNGVILITTKSGVKKGGATTINYKYEYSTHEATNITKVMTAQEYVEYFTEAAEYDGISGSSLTKRLDQLNSMDANSKTVWTDEIFTVAPQHEHSLSFTGGGDKTSYFASASFLDQDGIIGGEKDNLKRYSFRINASSEIKPWFTVGTNVGYTRFKKNDLGNASNEYGGIINNALTYDPSLPVVYNSIADIPAIYVNDPLGFNAMLKNEDDKYYSKSLLSMGEAWNPVAQIDYTHNTYIQDKIVGKIYGELKPFEWLKFTSSLNVDYAYQLREQFEGLHFYGVSPLTDDSLVQMINRFDRWYTYSLDNYLTFNKQFGIHSVEAMVGQYWREYQTQYLRVYGKGIPYNSIDYAYPSNIYNIKQTQVDGHARDHETQASYFGRFAYNYMEKYMFQAQGRIDGSSRLAPENKFKFFPSFSAGWIISKEDFFANMTSIINNLKLRASWGRNGSTQSLDGYYPYVSTMISTAYYQDGTGGLRLGSVPGRPGNPNLTWEISDQTDIGVDFTFIDNSLTFSADYYIKSTINQLSLKSDQPEYLGFQDVPFENKGEVKNSGWEFDLGYRQMESDLKYSIIANLSYLKNEVVSYGEEDTYRDGANVGQLGVINRYEPGYPVWYFYGMEADGIFQTQEEIDAYVNSDGVLLQPKAKPGDIKWVDQPVDSTGLPNGEIDEEDRVYLGKPMPDWIFGLTASLEYKGIDLTFTFQGQTGNQIYWAGYRKDRADYNRPEFFYTERWHGEGTSDYYPRATYTDANNNFQVSSLNIYNGDYLRLKYVTLGYTFPSNLTNKIIISKMRVYLTTSNLLTFTKYPGMDPEIGTYGGNDTYGIDRGLYPPTKVTTFGVNITF